ncbi:MAG: hypothetical protein KAT05_06545 [Spirochaetes bacterium]|nr:hypothetical protein [Spirochaetota bacterium]
MLIPDNRIEVFHIKSKYDLLDTLLENNSKVVHISCHGDGDLKNNENYCMLTPNGKIHPSELYENDGLRGRNVIITGCLLGRSAFANEFLENTQAKSLIAPLKKIYFSDSALWCVNFYHHLFSKNSFSFISSYNYMKKNLKIQGGMKMFPQKY